MQQTWVPFQPIQTADLHTIEILYINLHRLIQLHPGHLTNKNSYCHIALIVYVQITKHSIEVRDLTKGDP
jgi:hypothetical protein